MRDLGSGFAGEVEGCDLGVRSRSARCLRADCDRSTALIKHGSKGRGRSRKREIGGVVWHDAAIAIGAKARLQSARCCDDQTRFTLPTLSLLSLSLCCSVESFFLSLFLPLRVSVPEVI